MINLTLPKFQEYLHSEHLVNPKYIPYYASWASKYLAYSNTHKNLTHDLRVEDFLNHLKSQSSIADWQNQTGIVISYKLLAVSCKPNKIIKEALDERFP